MLAGHNTRPFWIAEQEMWAAIQRSGTKLQKGCVWRMRKDKLKWKWVGEGKGEYRSKKMDMKKGESMRKREGIGTKRREMGLGDCWSPPEGSRERLWQVGSSGYKLFIAKVKVCSSCPWGRVWLHLPSPQWLTIIADNEEVTLDQQQSLMRHSASTKDHNRGAKLIQRSGVSSHNWACIWYKRHTRPLRRRVRMGPS